jgi:hypothetical protein
LKTLILTIITLLSTNLFFAQEACSSYDISNYFEEYDSISKTKEKENEKRFNKAVALYAKVKKWSEKQSSAYQLMLISDDSFLTSIDKKQKVSKEAKELLKKVEEVDPTVEDCLNFLLVKRKFEEIALENDIDWETIIQKVAIDYKVVAKKDMPLSE